MISFVYYSERQKLLSFAIAKGEIIMTIKRTLSAIMSMSLALSSAIYAPVSHIYAAEDIAAELENISEGDHKDEYTVAQGSLNISAPDKIFYKIGEELDLTGGRISGAGAVGMYRNGNGYTVMNWDNFGADLKLSDLDVSEFDNTKPGIYKIKAKSMNFNVDKDETGYGSFYVMVISGDEVTEEDKLAYEDATETFYYVNGSIKLTPPDKTVYKAGEKIDLTGCTISGSGCIFKYNQKKETSEYIDTWIIEQRQATAYDLTLDRIDMYAEGNYAVYARLNSINGYDIPNWSADTNYFEIEIVPSDEGANDDNDNVCITTAIADNDDADVTTITTIADTHRNYEINEDNVKVADIQNGKIITEDGRKFSFGGMSDDSARVKKGDIIQIRGYFHYLKETDEYSACTGTFKITETSEETTVTTAPAADSNGTKKTVIYTGAKEFNVVSVETYPTQTVFIEGEEFNTAGLNIKAQRYIPYDSLGLNADEYEPEPVTELKDIYIEPYSVTIIDEDGNSYNGGRFCQLPSGKYTVICNQKETETIGFVDWLLYADITYDIEIKKSDRKLDFEQIKTSDDKPICTDYRYYQEFMGVAAYPEKTVYSRGEELDLTGLIIKLQKKWSPISLDSSDYAEEPVYLKTSLPSTEIMTVTDSDGTEYAASDFASLTEGKYTISCKSEDVVWDHLNKRIENVDISYEVEIKAPAGENVSIKADKNVSGRSGDANEDGTLDLADAVLIMQTLANPDKYAMSDEGKANADIYGENDGVTNMDALQIQKILLKLI